jgi:ADP-ribose pyrophosphatase YjhB (NUDIX family)
MELQKGAKIFLVNKNQLLFYLRDNKPYIIYPGYWDLIGGTVEENENVSVTLLREIKEEIDCEVFDIEYMGYVEEIYRGKKLHTEIFIGKINKPLEKIILREGQRLSYFKLEELEKIKLCPLFKKFLKNKNNYNYLKRFLR